MVTLRGFAGGSFIQQVQAAAGPDTTPDAFFFTGQFGVPVSSVRTSNAITVTGINAASPISIGGDASSQYSVNGGAFTAVAGSVISGDSVVVRHNSSAVASSQIDTTLTIGGVSGTFSSITAAAIAPTPAPAPNVTPAVVQASKADLVLIFNMALGRLGVGQAIGTPTELSVPAKLCNRFYNQCRQEVLRAFPWGFALRAEPLALVADQTFPGWSYVYQYPVGCITMRAVADSQGIRRVFSSTLACDPCWPTVLQQVRMPWQKAIKTDGASQCLLSDVSNAWGFFTTDVANTGAFDVDFASVVADRLAMEVGGPLQARADLITAAGQRYVMWRSEAMANAMNEQKDDPVPESLSITCRY